MTISQPYVYFVDLDVQLISRENGCGKTMQLPQYILESEIKAFPKASCNIICSRKMNMLEVPIKNIFFKGYFRMNKKRYFLNNSFSFS